ncbi:ceramide glucosyltransferase-like [Biomphalaria glabrata]|uniref:ceramide glucosyltransferase n=1 Tax=Biomphalaria glabrata TaxID=6526 RepID=A0A9W2ZG25_BIOGL|nr:ceramide glucosyltransferase-like [Biomphalaria glabrata]XP_055873957.1 ceramide glucosyltransferase-like [Biomphalaria glabrata]XP_055873963.1 ceramide glucosyltransferase-like [Biomphalaria glabrata]
MAVVHYSVVLLVLCLTTSTSHNTRDTDRSQFGMWSWDPEDTLYYVQFILASVALMIYTGVMFFTIVSLVASKLYLHKPSGMLEMGDVVPGVSIIKPLMGVDPLLEYNLESHFKLAYPKFELLFCFHDDQDAAISLVNKLHERYHHVDVKLFIGGAKDIVNPMVQNMAPAYNAVQYEFVWISSSRIEASDVILNDMTSKLQKPNVALVHQIPFTTDSPGFGSTVEKIYFGSAMARFYIAFNMLGLCCVTGMSYIFKKTSLDQVNGLAWYGRYLAEDFFLTNALHERGKLVMSAIPAKQNVGQTTLCGFIDRMVRWVRLRLNMMTIVTLFLEPLCDCFPLGAITAWSLHHFFDIHPLYFLLAHVFSWIIMDYVLVSNVQNGPLLFSKFEFLRGWFIRELSATYVFIIAVVNLHYIHWGHRKFRVKFGGLTELVHNEIL